MRQILMTVGVIMTTASVAGATGGFGCDIADDNMDFTVSGGMSHGMGGAILGYEASARIGAKEMPEALREPDLSAGMVHHWFDYPDLFLHFYAETTGDEPFASFDLILKTEASEDEELSYEGDYRLSIFDGETGEVFELTGKVTCVGE